MNIEIRTDLALETRESFEGTDTEVSGVVLEEEKCMEGAVKVTRVVIKTDSGAKAMQKPKGTYLTLESSLFNNGTYEDAACVSNVIKEYIVELFPKKKINSILIAGLGNADATPDALGPATMQKIEVTRNFSNETENNEWQISCVVPGVMAKTGMESMEVIKGVATEIRPDVVIAIDALAARNVGRLGTTIQLTDTGINPGSGVGNHRAGINKDTIGIPVIAIGIPTVIEIATIVSDIMDNLMQMFAIHKDYQELSGKEQYQFINELIKPEIGTLYVTPKDIDENINYMAYILSEALNRIWTKSQNE